ncbi:MAG: type 3 dihydrofolate reductase [Aquisalimonadaceae bacterium]
MKISLIAALTRDRVIGRDNDLPWRIRADMRFFRETTMGKPIIMGRRNFESIGRPLPKRTNIILTRDRNYTAEGCLIAHDVDQAMKLAEGAMEIMVIGGAEIYRLFLPRADRLYLTWVDAEIDGDTHFPEFQAEDWDVVERHQQPAGEDSPYDLLYETLDRRR